MGRKGTARRTSGRYSASGHTSPRASSPANSRRALIRSSVLIAPYPASSMPPAPLHVVSVLTTSEKGGAEYSNVDLLRGLLERGVRVKLLTNHPEQADGSGVPVEGVELGPKLGRRTVSRVALGFVPWLVRLAWLLWRERAAAGPIDVLLVHYKKEQLMAALLPRRLAGSVVWAEWGPVPFEFRRGLPRMLYVAAARRAATIVAISGGTKRSIAALGVPAERIEVLPNAVDVEAVDFDPAARERLRAEWGADPDTFVAGCVSRLHHKKRNDVLVRALGDLDGDAILVVAGDGEEEAALRALAAPYGDRVRFIPTPRGYIQGVYSACDVALFAPSPTEGSPISVVFAQLARRPVVSTGSEGAEDLVTEGTGTIVSREHDPVALAQVLDEYRRDPARREREGERARAEAMRRHDRRRVEDRFEAALRDAARPG
jgi:glycosyltransferase involved in cell wall biosynthesis